MAGMTRGGPDMTERVVNLCEEQYEITFYRWQHTPRWRLIARWSRRKEWALWLRALTTAVMADR